tara:strand:+ start:208 stop:1026 length:819 start_codon:yes stop_codon:yes gene_type:complete
MLSKLFHGLLVRIKKLYILIIYNFSKKYNKDYDLDISLLEVSKHFQSLENQYMYFHHSFWHKLPDYLRDHRSYFNQKQRGFGEDAFHALWYELMKEYKPKNMLEVGVYRGQVISLWALVADELDISCDIHGISPFTSAGDEVSAYISDINYYDDVINNFNHFSLSLPNLHRGFSTEDKMIDVIKSKKWDVIYIDGSHDYDVVKSDFDICSSMLSPGGIIVMDDSALDTRFEPPIYSSSGHPGPSRLANEINQDEYKEILSVGHNRVFQKNLN